MIRNEVCCDICGHVVAEIEPGLFKKKSVIKRYMIYTGVEYCKKVKYHICSDCVYEIRRAIEKKEQSK